jgi:hypothetical protein
VSELASEPSAPTDSRVYAVRYAHREHVEPAEVFHHPGPGDGPRAMPVTPTGKIQKFVLPGQLAASALATGGGVDFGLTEDQARTRRCRAL